MRNAAVDVPRSMVVSILVNGTMGFVWLITLLYVAPNLSLLLTYPVPFIGIIINALNNLGGTIFVELIIIYSAVAATIGLVSSTSRTLWAFARDKGIPFSTFFSRVNNRDQIPANAVVISTLISMLIGVIYFGNTTAFNAILSVATTSMYLTYLVPIALMLYGRKNHVVLGPWNLGRFGLLLNVVAVLFTFFFFVLLNFPPVLSWVIF
jgi:choline transport protein